MSLVKSFRISLSSGAWILVFTVLAEQAKAAPKDQASSTPKIIDSTGLDPKLLPAEGWHLQQPPYPYQAFRTHEQGHMNVVVVTGATGRVVKVSVLSSVPHPILDSFTAKWAYAQWSGPHNHKAKIPVTYALR